MKILTAFFLCVALAVLPCAVPSRAGPIINSYLFAPAGGGYEAEIEAWSSSIVGAGGTLSTNNKNAWNAVVAGAKTSGYWSSIKTLVPLAGPSQAGAGIPIIGTTPTQFGTAAGYTTAGGFLGNGSTFYFDSNIPINSATMFGGQNDFYFGCYITSPTVLTGRAPIGGNITAGGKAILDNLGTSFRFYSGGSGQTQITLTTTTFTGVLSILRSGATSAMLRAGATTQSITTASTTPTTDNILVFRRAGGSYWDGRIGAYWMGLSSANESHFRGLLDTCFAALN